MKKNDIKTREKSTPTSQSLILDIFIYDHLISFDIF